MEKYSVLMSVYIKAKAGEFCAAVDSMLRQTIPPEEITLVCDGPLTQDLEIAIAKYTMAHPPLFTIIRFQENQGLGSALQAGLLACRNELVARMDADDISLPDRMEKQLAAMHRYNIPAIVGGQIAEFVQNPSQIISYRQVPLTDGQIRKQIGFRCPFNHMTVLLHKPQILAAGGYQALSTYEDYDLWVRLLAQGHRACNIPDLCCYARIDPDFYRRRGGWRYFLKTLKMERTILAHHFIDPLQFFCNSIARFSCTVLMPPICRKWFYIRFLRKKEIF